MMAYSKYKKNSELEKLKMKDERQKAKQPTIEST